MAVELLLVVNENTNPYWMIVGVTKAKTSITVWITEVTETKTEVAEAKTGVTISITEVTKAKTDITDGKTGVTVRITEIAEVKTDVEIAITETKEA